MSVPMVTSCCCCFSLATGALVIGYLYTTVAAVELFVYSMIVTLRPLGPGTTELSTHKFAYFTSSAVVSFLQLLCGVLLIVATTKKRALLTLPWTIVTGILTVVYFVLCVTGISLILQDTGEMLAEEASMILFHLTRACISIYCVMVVHSRHKQIMNEKSLRRAFDQRAHYSRVVSAQF